MSAPRLVDTLHVAFHVPSTQDGEWGVLVPHGRVWWLICPVAATLYVRSDDDFEDCSDPTCEWIEDVHRRAGEIARLMATPSTSSETSEGPVMPSAATNNLHGNDPSAMRP